MLDAPHSDPQAEGLGGLVRDALEAGHGSSPALTDADGLPAADRDLQRAGDERTLRKYRAEALRLLRRDDEALAQLDELLSGLEQAIDLSR